MFRLQFTFSIALIFVLLDCAQFDSQGSPIGYLFLNGSGITGQAVVDAATGTDSGSGSGSGSGGGTMPAGWEHPDSSHRRTLSLNTGGIGSTLNNVPVLVKLDSTRIDYSQTAAGGVGLRFYDSSGTSLSFEIETWDPSGTSILWVKMPTVSPGATADAIKIYYGNSAPSDGQNVNDVWSENYNLVLHLSETTGNGGTRSDSSGTVAAGTFTDADGDSDPAFSGQLGTADDFNGDADSIDLGDLAAFQLTTYTISGWFKTGCPTPFCTLVARNSSQTGRAYYLGIWNGAFPGHNNGELVFRTSSGSSIDIDIGSGWILDDDTWHYFSAVLDGTTLASLYIDGGAAVTQAPTGVPDMTAANLIVGHDGFSAGSRYFSGGLDEIRISSVARSADWVTVQYLSQTDALVSYGTEESW